MTSFSRDSLKTFLKNMWPRTLGLQLALYLLFLLVVSIAVFSVHTIQVQVKNISSNMQSHAKVLASNISIESKHYLLMRDSKSLEKLLLRNIEFPNILNIKLSDANGLLLGDVTRNENIETEEKYVQKNINLPENKEPLILYGEEVMIVWQPIILSELIGWVKLSYSLDNIKLFKLKAIKNSILDGVIFVLFSLILLLVYLRRTTSTMERYTNFADNLNIIKGAKVEVSKDSVELERLGIALNSASENLYEQSLKISTAMAEMEGLAVFPEMNPNIVLSMNMEGRVQYLNPYGESLISKLKIVQADIRLILPDNLKNIIHECLINNKTIHAVETIYQERTFLWTFSPVINQELVHGYALEITQRKKALAQARSSQIEKMTAEAENKSKSTFLANMSHEIRTPLTAIIGFSETLLDTSQDMTERVESINTVIRNGKHLLKVINDILDLSKVEAGKLDVEQLKVSPFELLSDIHSLISLTTENKGLFFDIKYDFPIPEIILTDPLRLKQIIINLCNNAVKFTEKGGVTVKVSYDHTNHLLIMKIIDTGIGLSTEQINKIFHPFTQADTTTTRQYGGTGLGLYLSKQLATKLGGNISVESTPNVGSCFSLTITTGFVSKVKLLSYIPDIKSKSTQPIINSVNEKVSGKVLLAEDNVDNQRLVSMYLKKLGAEVVLAKNGKEAIEYAYDFDFDLILMDMQMPVMNGVDATIRLREMGYEKPIVAISANAMKDDIDICYNAGCDGFIQKPISQQAFMTSVTRFLKPTDTLNEDRCPITSSLLIDEPEMKELVQRFVAKIPQYIENIYQCNKNKSWDNLRQYTHDLKGTSGNYGFDEIYKSMQKIEFELTKENFKAVDSIINNLEGLYGRIQAGLQKQG